MKSVSRENQADIVEAFNSTSRYLDDLLNINNIYFDQMVDRIYPTEPFGFESLYVCWYSFHLELAMNTRLCLS